MSQQRHPPYHYALVGTGMKPIGKKRSRSAGINVVELVILITVVAVCLIVAYWLFCAIRGSEFSAETAYSIFGMSLIIPPLHFCGPVLAVFIKWYRSVSRCLGAAEKRSEETARTLAQVEETSQFESE